MTGEIYDTFFLHLVATVFYNYLNVDNKNTVTVTVNGWLVGFGQLGMTAGQY